MLTEEKFELSPFSNWDKSIYIVGPMASAIELDHDDVDHDQVQKEAKALVELLNKHWVPIEEKTWFENCPKCNDSYMEYASENTGICRDCKRK
jgi:hypothetical protein